jgi:ParB-like chromosome segregation protein Spo0J
MTTLPIHPLAALVPDMADHEYAELRQSIKDNGFDDTFPIVVFDGMILDGRHRYRAALEVGAEPVFVEFHPRGEDSPARFVLRSLARRSLTAGQRAALATEMLPALEKEAEKREKMGKRNPTQKVAEGRAPESTEVAARAAGTNKEYVKAAKKVKEQAPETFDKLKQGKITLAQAKTAISKPPPPAPEPEEVTDPEGRVVTDPALLDVFRHGDEFADLIRQVQAIRRDMLALAEKRHGSWLHDRESEIKRDCAGLVKYLKESTPHTACPMTANCGPKCKVCEGLGFVSAGRWNVTAEAIKGAAR